MAPELRREQLLDAALGVIIERGYSGVSIEAIARKAGVTRPVVYDHFPNLGRLLYALVEREERYALEQLEGVVSDDPGDLQPEALLARGLRKFLDGVASRPATWRIILLPPSGTPSMVRQHVERNRMQVLEQIESMVRWAMARLDLPADLDVELTARAIRDLAQEWGRMLLTDPDRYPPERYEQFVRTLMALVSPRHEAAD
jgi:AcrR family transcriptional regulator